MESLSILPILKKIPLFATFEEEDYKTIIANITLQYFPKKYQIFSEGDSGDAMYIIKSGSVSILRQKDEEKKVATLGENDFFGEMALFSDEPRNASAKTESDCELFVLKKDDFCDLLLKDQNMANRVSKEFMRRVKENNREIPQ